MTDQPLFHPDMMRGRRITIVGQGALGSALYQNIVRMHVHDIDLYDFDRVEARNRFNQRVFEEDIGANKCAAQMRIAELIERGASKGTRPRGEAVTPTTALSGIVLAAVDSMSARRAIWEAAKKNPNVSFFVDGRVGLDGGKVYGLDPNNVEHIARYEDPIHMHKDPERVVGACKTEFPLPAMADIVAGHMLMRLVRWLHLEQGCEDPYDNFIGFFFVPTTQHVVERWDAPEDDQVQLPW